jgi:hypothetical protein
MAAHQPCSHRSPAAWSPNPLTGKKEVLRVCWAPALGVGVDLPVVLIDLHRHQAKSIEFSNSQAKGLPAQF